MTKYVVLPAVLLVAALTIVAVAMWRGMNSFVFAWILNFMLMMVVLSFTQTFKPQLASTYYRPQPWEADGKVYTWLGVNVYRKLLVWVGWEKANKATNPVKKKLDALTHLEYTSRQSEFGHLIIFFAVLAVTLLVGVTSGLSETVWLISLNVLLNLYPIFVQRYNRPRLLRAIQRSSSTEKMLA
ncbi:hypothetical protein HNV11_14495 [Spirosoma taeanense]|uniref:Glycosyl-4,4'-diaponeurosporenoate acyltransferase n=1 Tax=Spirosoma taeanense TaxID=2735870 RepID=A0A6M5YB80_9BACT|nr:hypothetical protein [Spirosoma taeanense]QJW90501.1 hypothetical protein HNV11_14495 [Spirosoma taeanense]